MDLQTGELVQHLAGIPDHGAGIVLEQYVSEQHRLDALSNPYREVRVLWQKPHGYISWVGNHALERVSAEGPEKSE